MATRGTWRFTLCIALILLASACPACSETRVPPSTVPTDETLASLRFEDSSRAHFDTARDLFEIYCGLCHLPYGDSAMELSLSVYDLSDAAPLTALSDAQLAEAYRRFDEQNIPADEQKRLVGFFAQTLRMRDANPTRFPRAQRASPAADAVVTPVTGCIGRACFEQFSFAQFGDDVAAAFAASGDNAQF